MISPVKQKKLAEEFARLGLKESDIEEDFVRSQGAGGQKVNKTSTCVFLRHVPTGITVKCQETRNQSVNRFLARRILAEKISTIIDGEKSRKQQAIEKIRRQKRRRSRRAKEKMLADKKHHSEKKEMRKRIRP